jgi:uncharacterized protein YeaO (DUF488 family)
MKIKMIKIRRIYDPEENGERYKVLIDRLWPRGISKDNAKWDEWIKDVSPSNELRKWFSHDPSKWKQFKKLYEKELILNQVFLAKLKQLEMKYGILTLLYSARDKEYNNARVLKEFLDHYQA